MIKYKKEMIEENIPVSLVCDVCKKEYDCKKDVMEIQEFQSINIIGGYDSVFGDGRKLKLDICQHCLKKLLGEYMVEGEEGDI